MSVRLFSDLAPSCLSSRSRFGYSPPELRRSSPGCDVRCREICNRSAPFVLPR
jgi:hypothetical protein